MEILGGKIRIQKFQYQNIENYFQWPDPYLVDFGLTPRQETIRAQNVKNGIIKPNPKLLPDSKDHQYVSLKFEIPSICLPTLNFQIRSKSLGY